MVPRRQKWLFVACIPLIVLCATTMAPASPKLPLRGFYRMGRYMPVQCDGPSRLSGDGAITTETSGGVTPWLSLSNIRTTDFTPESPLHPLADDERLIGTTLPNIADAAAAGARIFPNQRIIPLALDPANPVPGPATAWTSLDALILDANSAAIALRGDAISTLLAGGARIAVQSSKAPDTVWPWRQQDGLWILSNDAVSPIDPISPAALTPAQTWNPPVDAASGRTTILAILLAYVLSLGAASWLWRASVGRRALSTLMIAAIIGGWSIGFSIWSRRQSPAQFVIGSACVIDHDITALDEYTYARFVHAGRAYVPWRAMMLPLLPDSESANQIHLTLVYSESGAASWQMDSHDNAAVGFVQRTMLPIPPLANAGNDATPMLAIAGFYPRAHLLGTTAAPPGGWPGILLQADKTDSIQP